MKKLILFIIPTIFSGFFLSGHGDSMEKSTTPVVIYSGCDEGENEDPQPMLSGNVQDDVGNDIHRACVEIKTTLGVSVDIIGTDSSGHYFFNNVANGSYNLIVSASGYTTEVIPFTVTGSSQTINVILE